MPRSRPPVSRVLSDINITPLIDVMLVLLIIFMLVTPIASRGIDLHLPPTAAPVAITPPPSLVLALESAPDGVVVASLNRVPVAMSDLRERLVGVYETRADKTLFVRIEGTVRYGQAVAALDVARGAGVTRIGLLGNEPHGQ